jgi:hypothetical protein
MKCLRETDILMPAMLANAEFPTAPMLDASTVADDATVREYVQAIVMREHKLLKHLDAIEQYYISAAHDIQQYGAALAACIKKITL